MKYLRYPVVVLLILLVPLIVYAVTVDTLEGVAVTNASNIEGTTAGDTVEGQVLTSGAAVACGFGADGVYDWDGDSGTACADDVNMGAAIPGPAWDNDDSNSIITDDDTTCNGGTFCAKIVFASSGAITTEDSFAGQDGTVTVQVSFKFDSTDSDRHIVLYLTDSADAVMAGLAITSTNHITIPTAGCCNWENLGTDTTIIANTWYKVDFEMDMTTDTYNVEIDDVQKDTGQAMAWGNNGKTLSKIQLKNYSVGATTVNGWVDDIYVY